MSWYEALVTIIVAVFASTGFWSWVQSRGRNKSDDSKLLMGLAYSEIIERSESYLARGWISTDEYHELHHYLYEPYERKGGNGTAKRLVDQVAKLPPEPPESKG